MSQQRTRLNWDRVRPYLDDDIAARVESVRTEIDDAVVELVDNFRNQAKARADKLAAGDISAEFDESIASVRESLDEEMNGLRQRIEGLKTAVSEVLSEEDVEKLRESAETLKTTATDTLREIEAFREKVRTFGSSAGRRLGGVALRFITGGIV